MPELKGIEYLRKKLQLKKIRGDLRYDFYEMKNHVHDLGISSPPELRYWIGCLGWCGKAVDAMADRMQFREFRNDNFDMTGVFNMSNPDILYDSAILSALITSCSFIYISPDDDGFPRLQVIDGCNATGILDEITGLLYEGYAVLKRDDDDKPVSEAYFEPGRTIYFENGKVVMVDTHNVEYPLLVPIIYRPDAKRPFGHSRISRACMNIQESAVRSIKRSEISAEFYSFPQKYVAGLSPESEDMDSWKAALSAMLRFDKDEDGDHPVVGQFQQQTMTPHVDQLRMLASMFAGETGLTLDDLGFATENPSSAEAIKAAHENLRMTVRKAQKTFGSGFLNVGFLAACMRDDFAYKRNQIYLTRPIWEPVFEPDAAAMSGLGDAAIKINQAVPDFFDLETLNDLTGLKK